MKRGFYKMQNYEDKIYYSLGEAVTEQTQAISQAVQKTLENNGGVGIMTGSYDQNLSILSVSNLLLHSTGHTFDTFMEQTKGSLKNFFYDKEDILERDRFLQLHGTGEAQILTADGTVNDVRLCKEDATDEAGRQIWVMSVQVNWDHVNLTLLWQNNDFVQPWVRERAAQNTKLAANAAAQRHPYQPCLSG